ncbi:MAG TPA: hypothetical protein VJP87_00675 [Candidatus Acidoferrales bacterium]|nr:hypothetical protein [Candidatus Acidoferrales bacterium]
MNPKTYTGIVTGALLLAGAVALSAQEPALPPPDGAAVLMVQGPGPEMGPPAFGGPIEILGFEAGGHGRKVVTGAPFSAVATSETVQTLADGNTIDRKSEVKLYRDGQGRFRKDGTITAIGPLAVSGQANTFIVIHDPVAGKMFVLNPTNKVAHEMETAGQRGEPGPGAVVEKLRKHREAEGDVSTEDLGTQTVNGVSAQGKRVTRTIAAGQLGNAKPIVITFESWYSPDLQLVVMSKRSDPRFGTTTYNLTNVQRSEPDAALFTVPSDYTVKQGFGKGLRRVAPAAPPAEN